MMGNVFANNIIKVDYFSHVSYCYKLRQIFNIYYKDACVLSHFGCV